jgi:hypothetical protein
MFCFFYVLRVTGHQPPRIVAHVLIQVEQALATTYAETQLRRATRHIPTALDGLDVVPLAAPAKDFGEIAEPLFLDFDRASRPRATALKLLTFKMDSSRLYPRIVRYRSLTDCPITCSVTLLVPSSFSPGLLRQR